MARAPDLKKGRRAGAASGVLGTSGIHALSHRVVDDRAELPAGTAANYFPTRDELLTAAARRVFGLHIAAMEADDSQVAGPVGPGGLAELIGGALYGGAVHHRTRYLAIYELSLEATRRPALAEALSEMLSAALDVTIGQHRALGLHTTPAQVQVLMTLFGGVLLTLTAGPPEAVTPDAADTLARCLVAGVMATVPGSPEHQDQAAGLESVLPWRGSDARSGQGRGRGIQAGTFRR
jgi:DNA-binding transcriptional regulator YbjK